MRLPLEQRDCLKNEIKKFAPESKIYLFGSRADDNKKGGDIDILILSKKKLTFEQKVAIKWGFFKKFGEQKLDLVNFQFDEQDPFKDLVLDEAKEL
jgi:predicted nucleotidyltransferase